MEGWYAIRSFRAPGTYVDYLTAYLRSFFTQEPAAKVGIAAIVSVLATGAEVYGEALWTVVLLWSVDMLLGILRAARDPDEPLQWGKAIDGVIRLVVILVLPAAVHVAARFPESVLGVNLDGRPALFVISLLGAQEFFGTVDNAVSLVPGLERWRARIIRWDPDHTEPRMTHGEVLVMKDTETSEEED